MVHDLDVFSLRSKWTGGEVLQIIIANQLLVRSHWVLRQSTLSQLVQYQILIPVHLIIGQFPLRYLIVEL